MPRPKTKVQLLAQSHENFQKLLDYINALSKEDQLTDFHGETMNRNIRDVLAHLHHWHLMMLEWYQIGMSGQKPEMPAKGYTWKTTSDMNKWILEKYQKSNLNEVKNAFLKSHEEIRALIEKHSDEELFKKKRYHWTGSTSLAAYLISATSSHYDWGLKLIKKGKKLP
ncbi:ClbS/DfsB family four-helix bundle protein [Algoriphagus namhaensis]|uniref:ClbS/DfsB family four-helix bundle protein n=1 Tax=Algoriphagus namhaensis TaxID=915353 RepID=A0ABV8AU02_9BACT